MAPSSLLNLCLEKVADDIIFNLLNKLQEDSESRRELFGILLQIMEESVEKNYRDEVTTNVVRCLFYYSGRFQNCLLEEEKIRMIHCFSKSSDSFLIWELLLVEDFISFPSFDILYFYKKAMRLINVTYFAYLDISRQIMVLKFLNVGFPYLTTNMKLNLDRKELDRCLDNFLNSVFNVLFLAREDGESFEEELQSCAAEYIKFRCSSFHGEPIRVSTDIIDSILREVESHRSFVFLEYTLMRMIHSLLKYVDTESVKELWNERNLMVFVRCIHGQYKIGRRQQTVKISLAITCIEILPNLAFACKCLLFRKNIILLLGPYARANELGPMHYLKLRISPEGEHRYSIRRVDEPIITKWFVRTVELMEEIYKNLQKTRS